MQILIVLRVEAADGFGKPALRDGDEFCAAEVEIECGAEMASRSSSLRSTFCRCLFEHAISLASAFFRMASEILAEAGGIGGCARTG